MVCVRYAVAVAAALLLRCENTAGPLPDGFESLRAVCIEMNEDTYHEMYKWSKTNNWYAAAVRDGGEMLPGRIRIHGMAARRWPKKSFQCEVYAHGGCREIEHAMILSSQYSDPSFCRYRVADRLLRRAGLDGPVLEPVRVYINGEYQGLYLRIERIDRQFLQRRGLPVASLYEANRGVRFDQHGEILPEQLFDKELPDDSRSYDDIARLLAITNGGIDEHEWAALEEWLDMENALGYYATIRIAAHWDGIHNNMYLYYNPLIGKFQFIPWDLDHTFEWLLDSLPVYTNDLFEYFLEVSPYRARLIRMQCDILDTTAVFAFLDSAYATVAPYCTLDPFRPLDETDCARARDGIRSFLRTVARCVAAEAAAEGMSGCAQW